MSMYKIFNSFLLDMTGLILDYTVGARPLQEKFTLLAHIFFHVCIRVLLNFTFILGLLVIELNFIFRPFIIM